MVLSTTSHQWTSGSSLTSPYLGISTSRILNLECRHRISVIGSYLMCIGSPSRGCLRTLGQWRIKPVIGRHDGRREIRSGFTLQQSPTWRSIQTPINHLFPRSHTNERRLTEAAHFPLYGGTTFVNISTRFTLTWIFSRDISLFSKASGWNDI